MKKELNPVELDFLLRFPFKAGVVSPVDFLQNQGWGGIKVGAQPGTRSPPPPSRFPGVAVARLTGRAVQLNWGRQGPGRDAGCRLVQGDPAFLSEHSDVSWSPHGTH